MKQETMLVVCNAKHPLNVTKQSFTVIYPTEDKGLRAEKAMTKSRYCWLLYKGMDY